MSFQAMAWAVEQELPALQKLTLLLLANYAGNESGECWPSIGTIAKQAGMSRDSVMRAIREMENSGLLTVVRRTMEGVNLPNIYRLNLSAPARGVVADSHRGSSCGRVGVVADSDSKLSVQPVKDLQPIAPRPSGTAPAMQAAPAVIGLPTNKRDTDRPVTAAEVAEWSALYPAVDVMQELRNMRGWLLANATRRKTSDGMPVFVNNWLKKAQNEGSKHAQHQPTGRAGGRLSSIEQIEAARIAAGVPQRFDLIG